MRSFFPFFSKLKNYRYADFNNDLLAGMITAVLLVPQGIAYSLLAGLPAQFGLYASLLPPICYAFLGTSRTLCVAPVSLVAIMMASALQLPSVNALGNPVQSAVILTALCGLIMWLMAIFRMGGLVNFISHPVLTGFTSGAALLIIFKQLPTLLGLTALPDCSVDFSCYETYFYSVNLTALEISLFTFLVLLFFNQPLKWLLQKLHIRASLSNALAKCGLICAVTLTAFAVTKWHLNVTVVGDIPTGLPKLSLHFFDLVKWTALLPPATFIALIAYVESIAIAKVIANLRGEKIDPNQELLALGTANFAAAISGGMCVAGGFSQTMVNTSAGAKSQISMIVAAIALAITLVFFSSSIQYIPKAVLAVIILVAIFPLVRLGSVFHSLHYDKGDGIAEAMTMLGVLIWGIEEGLTLGIFLTFMSYLRKASHPHIAVLGRMRNTWHFRNVKNQYFKNLETWDELLLVRVDESITFTNIDFVEQFIDNELSATKKVKHVVLVFTSVSDIDMTALQALEQLNLNLQSQGILFHLAEIKHFVLVKLERSHLFNQLSGKVFVDTQEAVKKLIFSH